MSKAVLVIDMPESCDVCPIENDTAWMCPIIRKSTGNKDGEPRYSGRLAECPLRLLPEFREHMTPNWDEVMRDTGFNDCLREIRGMNG